MILTSVDHETAGCSTLKGSMGADGNALKMSGYLVKSKELEKNACLIKVRSYIKANKKSTILLLLTTQYQTVAESQTK